MAAEKELNLDASSHTASISDEQRRIRSQNATIRWRDPVFRQKVGQAISQSIKDKWKDPEYRKKSSRASRVKMKRIWQNPEYRERLSKTHKLKWQDPDFRASRTNTTITGMTREIWNAARAQDLIPRILEDGFITQDEVDLINRAFSTQRPRRIVSEELMDKFSIAVARVA